MWGDSLSTVDNTGLHCHLCLLSEGTIAVATYVAIDTTNVKG